MRRLGWALLVLALLLCSAPLRAGAACGDGVLDAGEVCDDGNLSVADCCSASCTLQACSVPPQPLVAWQALGPFDLGGRASALAVDPTNPNLLLVGTPAAGIWRSADRGLTWVAIAPWLDVAPVSALAIDPSNPNRYVASTGILQDTGTVADAVGSVFTSDAGVTWTVQSDPQRTAYVGHVLIWPGDVQRVLFATDRGLLLSLDGGTTRTEVKTGDSFTTVLADPFDSNTAWASGRLGLYRSQDRGATWSFVSAWAGLDTVENPGAATAVLAVSHHTPGLLRAAVQDLRTFTDTDRVILLESTNFGASWTELPPPAALCPVKDLCGFANALAIDPGDDARMLLGGDRLFRSVDGGQTWTALSSSVRGVHEIALDFMGAVVVGRSGVAVLDASWTTASLRNTGLPITQVTSLDARHDGSGALLLGTRDTGTVLGSGDPFAWRVAYGPNEGTSEARFDPTAPDVLYAGKRRGAFARSDDGGLSFVDITSGLDLQQSVLDVAPLAVGPLTAGELYTGRLQVFRTTDRGDTWSAFRPLGAPEVATLAPSPFAEGRLYFGLSQGGTLYKADGKFTDTFDLDPSLDARITSILPSPAAPYTIYVGMTNASTRRGALWRTTDFGATWEDRGFGKLPAVSDVVRDANGALYVATEKGVYRSSSEGLVWSPFNESLPTQFVTKLALQDGKVVAGTRGHGVFEVPAQPLVTVDSIPPGQRLLVDGVLHQGPVYEDWVSGSSHTIAPYLLQTEDTRQEFVSWSDGGAEQHTFTATGNNEWPTVAIRVLHRLRTAVTPAGGGTLQVDPVSASGFYPFQSVVQLVAVPAPDYRSSGWLGETSSVDRLLAAASMDGPRSVTATFEPLQIAFKSSPGGLPITIDGASVTPPQIFQWPAGSVHPVSAPPSVDLDPSDPLLYVFDRWSDYLPIDHSFEMRSDTFTADVTAYYLPTVPRMTVPAAGVQSVATLGAQHARHELSLELRPDAGERLPASLQWLRSATSDAVVTELALPRQRLGTRVNAWVQGTQLATNGGLKGDGRTRRTRIAFFNPGTVAVNVDLVLHATDGTALAGGNDLVAVPPGGQRVVMLDEVLGLDKTYAGLLTLASDGPLAMSVFGVGENLRPLDFTDPLLTHAFDESDEGVPITATTQVLLATPATEHVVVLANPDPVASTGNLRIVDGTGAPLVAEVDGVWTSSVAYSLAAGGHRVLRIDFPFGVPGGGVLPSARLSLEPSSGSMPRYRAVSERAIGTTRYGTSVLPRSLPPSVDGTAFYAPVDRARRDSGLVLTNRGGSAITVTLSLADAAGALSGTASVPLAAGAQTVALVSALFPSAPAGFRGELRASATAPVEATGLSRLVNGRGEEIVAGFPALVAATDPVGTPQRFAYAVDGDTWSSEWWLGSLAAPAVHVNLALRDATGTTKYLPMQAPGTP